jgi:predicted nucleic acid-binding protein
LILIELANSLSQPAQRPLALAIIEKMQTDSLTAIIDLTPERFEKALNLYKKRSDKAWGMIDCFSFIAMDEFGIKHALTFDEHFRQAGYKVPLL